MAGRVPHIWWYEVRNAFLTGERRSRLRPSDTSSFLQQLEHLPIWFEGSKAEGVVSMARRLDLTCYDAAYVELSARLALPLATLDRRLAVAADRAGVTLFAK